MNQAESKTISGFEVYLTDNYVRVGDAAGGFGSVCASRRLLTKARARRVYHNLDTIEKVTAFVRDNPISFP